MKILYFIVILFTFSVAPVQAQTDETAKLLLVKMAEAINKGNFSASFVVVKGNNMEPYKWLHGHHEGKELEHLSLLNGAGLEIVRINDKVTYFEPQSAPYSLNASHISGPIPEIFFEDITALEKSYRFILGGKGRIAGRPAQLVRIESKDQFKFNYWLWVDTESSLILKSAYVNQTGEALEQLQFTHVAMTEKVAKELLVMSKKSFPPAIPAAEQKVNKGNKGNWQIGWLPEGFSLLKSDRHNLNLNNELADYYLYGDGLVEVSVFVQRPLPGKRLGGPLSSGATSIFVYNAAGFDVSVVGNVPTKTAQAIAESVKRAAIN